MPYSYIDHQADVGLLATGDTLEEALADGVLGLLALMVDPATVRPGQDVPIEASGGDPAALYVALLNAVLALKDIHGLFFHDVRITDLRQTDDGWTVVGELRGEPFDRERHEVGSDVKAATYGGLLAEQDTYGWRLRCVLDL
jgi:SHS2 domain-containing protein